jgi:hypothetical protein
MIHYRKLNVDNFETMRIELEAATIDKVNANIRFWGENHSWFKTNAPTFYNFIESRKKVPIRMCRFYLTPAHDFLDPHADGTSDNRSPIGLNIPISGYLNTPMDWYSCPNDNFDNGHLGFNKTSASKVIDPSKLVKIDSTVIDSPTFVRTDVVHGIINDNITRRLVLSLRFPYSTTFGQNFGDVMNLEGL